LGDIIAKGTHQNECVELIKNNCEVVLKGNCEEFFSNPEHDITASEIDKKRANWVRSKVTSENLLYLKDLPFSYEIYISGRLVRFYHAHPEKVDKFVGNVDLLENLYSLFLPSKNTISDKKADVIVYGHIHTQFMQRIYNRVIINTGSIGNSLDVFRNDLKDGDIKNTACVNYLIIEGNVDSHNMDDSISYEFVNLSYDIEKELKSNTDNIEFESYKEEIINGKYRNMEKIYKSFIDRGIDIDKI
jgi:protein phosphatase